MSTIHFTLMGKGGVGKSFVTTILAEYLKEKAEKNLFCADTDPTNPTFSSYPSFAATHINIMTPEMNIDRANFDDLVDMLLAHEGDSVIDNGASSFLPMMSYICENKLIEALKNEGKEIVVHAPLVGGLGMDETLRGLDAILQNLPVEVVVWENEVYGPVVKNGKKFGESAFYQKHSSRIRGIVHITQGSADTLVKTLHKLTSHRLTFAEAQESKDFKYMEKQRLAETARAINSQLDEVAL
jgi:hypothetical protein